MSRRDGPLFGISCSIGRRAKMEDAFVVIDSEGWRRQWRELVEISRCQTEKGGRTDSDRERAETGSAATDLTGRREREESATVNGVEGSAGLRVLSGEGVEEKGGAAKGEAKDGGGDRGGTFSRVSTTVSDRLELKSSCSKSASGDSSVSVPFVLEAGKEERECVDGSEESEETEEEGEDRGSGRLSRGTREAEQRGETVTESGLEEQCNPQSHAFCPSNFLLHVNREEEGGGDVTMTALDEQEGAGGLEPEEKQKGLLRTCAAASPLCASMETDAGDSPPPSLSPCRSPLTLANKASEDTPISALPIVYRQQCGEAGRTLRGKFVHSSAQNGSVQSSPTQSDPEQLPRENPHARGPRGAPVIPSCQPSVDLSSPAHSRVSRRSPLPSPCNMTPPSSAQGGQDAEGLDLCGGKMRQASSSLLHSETCEHSRSLFSSTLVQLRDETANDGGKDSDDESRMAQCKGWAGKGENGGGGRERAKNQCRSPVGDWGVEEEGVAVDIQKDEDEDNETLESEWPAFVPRFSPLPFSLPPQPPTAALPASSTARLTVPSSFHVSSGQVGKGGGTEAPTVQLREGEGLRQSQREKDKGGCCTIPVEAQAESRADKIGMKEERRKSTHTMMDMGEQLKRDREGKASGTEPEGKIGPALTYAAVFDGHGGSWVANFAKRYLHKLILSACRESFTPRESLDSLPGAVLKAFTDLDGAYERILRGTDPRLQLRCVESGAVGAPSAPPFGSPSVRSSGRARGVEGDSLHRSACSGSVSSSTSSGGVWRTPLGRGSAHSQGEGDTIAPSASLSHFDATRPVRSRALNVSYSNSHSSGRLAGLLCDVKKCSASELFFDGAMQAAAMFSHHQQQWNSAAADSLFPKTPLLDDVAESEEKGGGSAVPLRRGGLRAFEGVQEEEEVDGINNRQASVSASPPLRAQSSECCSLSAAPRSVSQTAATPSAVPLPPHPSSFSSSASSSDPPPASPIPTQECESTQQVGSFAAQTGRLVTRAVASFAPFSFPAPNSSSFPSPSPSMLLSSRSAGEDDREVLTRSPHAGEGGGKERASDDGSGEHRQSETMSPGDASISRSSASLSPVGGRQEEESPPEASFALCSSPCTEEETVPVAPPNEDGGGIMPPCSQEALSLGRLPRAEPVSFGVPLPGPPFQGGAGPSGSGDRSPSLSPLSSHQAAPRAPAPFSELQPHSLSLSLSQTTQHQPAPVMLSGLQASLSHHPNSQIGKQLAAFPPAAPTPACSFPLRRAHTLAGGPDSLPTAKTRSSRQELFEFFRGGPQPQTAGSTALVALLCEQEQRLVLANLGDCRAVLAREKEKAPLKRGSGVGGEGTAEKGGDSETNAAAKTGELKRRESVGGQSAKSGVSEGQASVSSGGTSATLPVSHASSEEELEGGLQTIMGGGSGDPDICAGEGTRGESSHMDIDSSHEEVGEEEETFDEEPSESEHGEEYGIFEETERDRRRREERRPHSIDPLSKSPDGTAASARVLAHVKRADSNGIDERLHGALGQQKHRRWQQRGRAPPIGSLESIRLTFDHKPDRKDERLRIERGGGSVVHKGCARLAAEGLNRRLAVSRALGDFDVKDAHARLLLAEPECSAVNLCPLDRFLVLATDGVWDVLSDEDAVEIVAKTIWPKRAAWVRVKAGPPHPPLDPLPGHPVLPCSSEEKERTGERGQGANPQPRRKLVPPGVLPANRATVAAKTSGNTQHTNAPNPHGGPQARTHGLKRVPAPSHHSGPGKSTAQGPREAKSGTGPCLSPSQRCQAHRRVPQPRQVCSPTNRSPHWLSKKQNLQPASPPCNPLRSSSIPAASPPPAESVQDDDRGPEDSAETLGRALRNPPSPSDIPSAFCTPSAESSLLLSPAAKGKGKEGTSSCRCSMRGFSGRGRRRPLTSSPPSCNVRRQRQRAQTSSGSPFEIPRGRGEGSAQVSPHANPRLGVSGDGSLSAEPGVAPSFLPISRSQTTPPRLLAETSKEAESLDEDMLTYGEGEKEALGLGIGGRGFSRIGVGLLRLQESGEERREACTFPVDRESSRSPFALSHPLSPSVPLERALESASSQLFPPVEEQSCRGAGGRVQNRNKFCSSIHHSSSNSMEGKSFPTANRSSQIFPEASAEESSERDRHRRACEDFLFAGFAGRSHTEQPLVVQRTSSTGAASCSAASCRAEAERKEDGPHILQGKGVACGMKAGEEVADGEALRSPPSAVPPAHSCESWLSSRGGCCLSLSADDFRVPPPPSASAFPRAADNAERETPGVNLTAVGQQQHRQRGGERESGPASSVVDVGRDLQRRRTRVESSVGREGGSQLEPEPESVYYPWRERVREAAEAVISAAFERGSQDNMTCVVLLLKK